MKIDITPDWEPSDLDRHINSWLSIDKDGNDYLNQEDIMNLRNDLKELFEEQKSAYDNQLKIMVEELAKARKVKSDIITELIPPASK